MTSRREKLLRDVQRKISKHERDRDYGIKLLVKACNELPALRKREARLLANLSKLADRPVPDTSVTQDAPPVPASHVPEDGSPLDDDVPVVQDDRRDEPLARQDDGLEIPHYLQRSALPPDIAAAAYAVANKHNKPPTPEQTKLVDSERTKVKKEHKKALLTGKLRKWPLTGKAARDVLR